MGGRSSGHGPLARANRNRRTTGGTCGTGGPDRTGSDSFSDPTRKSELDTTRSGGSSEKSSLQSWRPNRQALDRPTGRFRSPCRLGLGQTRGRPMVGR
jgi:hypothetical protein